VAGGIHVHQALQQRFSAHRGGGAGSAPPPAAAAAAAVVAVAVVQSDGSTSVG